MAPGSGIDDSTLDIYTIKLGRHRDLVGVARYLKSGDFIQNELVNQYRTPRVVLETEPELSVNVDGELVARTPQSFSVARNALKVLVPRKLQRRPLRRPRQRRPSAMTSTTPKPPYTAKPAAG